MKLKLFISILFCFRVFSTCFAEEVKYGENWIQYIFSVNDFETFFGVKENEFWVAKPIDKIRPFCLLRTKSIPYFGRKKIDVVVRHDTFGAIYAEKTKLAEAPLFGIEVLNNGSIISLNYKATGEFSDWESELISEEVNGKFGTFITKTKGVISSELDSFEISGNGNLSVGICVLFENIEVKVNQISIQISNLPSE